MEKENKKINPDEVTTINELAIIMRDSFQSNQEYTDKRFDNLTNEMRSGFKKVDENFKQVTEKINNLSRNAADVIRQEDFDKLTDRVEVVEEVLDLKLKRA